MVRTRIRVTGTVQGVGFRPFVYRHAVALGLAGSVRNDSDGVLIDVEGDAAGIAELHRRLTDEPPPLARITGLVCEDVARSPAVAVGFRIVETPIIFVDRRVGQSKMSRAIFAEALLKVWALWFCR